MELRSIIVTKEVLGVDNFLAKKTVMYMMCGLMGCIFMGISDWLMIFSDASYEGPLAWLTVGVSH